MIGGGRTGRDLGGTDNGGVDEVATKSVPVHLSSSLSESGPDAVPGSRGRLVSPDCWAKRTHWRHEFAFLALRPVPHPSQAQAPLLGDAGSGGNGGRVQPVHRGRIVQPHHDVEERTDLLLC